MFVERQSECVVGTQCLHGWSFSEPWEIVPGVWTFELFLNETSLASQTFLIVPQ